MEISVILLRLFFTFALSCVFGVERQKSHKPIGFGAFIFVSVGACALAITATIIEPENPLPLLGAIVTGIGFLGAGALIKTSDKTFGFTTAASIWLFAIFGIINGVGEYFLGFSIYEIY
jgi:putative Mg2+ transporter-C (MgtC) family protein